MTFCPAAAVRPTAGAATRQRVPSVRRAAATACPGVLRASEPFLRGLPMYFSSSNCPAARTPH
eukprot:811671-Alexandrium_andersonii.AAC.1